MTKLSSLAVFAVAVIAVMLARPSVSYAQRWRDEANVGGLNRLFDRWVDNRREAQGRPPSAWPPPGYYDPDNDTIGNRLFDRWIDNRRAAQGRPPSAYSMVYGWNRAYYEPGATGTRPYNQGQYYAPAQVQVAPDNVVSLRLVVPPDAKVWIENQEMTPTGAVRLFESPSLAPGMEYTYHIKARWRGPDGKEVTRKREVDVRANQRLDLDLDPAHS